MQYSKARVLSVIGMLTSFGVLLTAVMLTWSTQSAKYFPLILVGLVGGCITTPFYYYYKAKAKTSGSADEAVMRAYNAAGQEIAKEKRHDQV